MHSTGQKIVFGLVASMILATVLLPNRQIVPALGAASKLATGVISTSQGTSSGAVGG